MRRWILITLLLLTTINLPLLSAPAPLIKKPLPKGEWPQGKWRTSNGNIIVTFHRDHTYHEIWYDIEYKGVWYHRYNEIIVRCRRVKTNTDQVSKELNMHFEQKLGRLRMLSDEDYEFATINPE